MSDLISGAAAIDALERIFDRCEEIEAHLSKCDPDRVGYKMYPDWLTVWKYLHQLPSAQPERKKGEWTTEQVAELLANMFGEECACNFNGIDEWLPSACKYSETTCPNPKEKHGCWMQFLIQGGADMKGDYDEKPM